MINIDDFIKLDDAVKKAELETAEAELISFDWNYQPPDDDISLTLNDKRILSDGNILLISAPQGVGKSAVCEAIIAAIIAPEPDNIDTFHIKVVGNNRNSVLYIDTERSNKDFWKSCSRSLHRAGLKIEDDFNNIVDFKLASTLTISNKITKCLEYIYKSTARFVIIDNIADLVLDVNNAEKCNNLVAELSAFCKRENRSLILTIHSNPGSDKSRGHLGSELLRRAEAIFTIKSDRVTGIKTFTQNYQFGKNRSDVDNLETSFRWVDEPLQRGYYSCDSAPPKNPKDKEIQDYIEKLFQKQFKYNYSEIVKELALVSGKTEATAKKWISKYSSENFNLIHKDDDNRYILNLNEISNRNEID